MKGIVSNRWPVTALVCGGGLLWATVFPAVAQDSGPEDDADVGVITLPESEPEPEDAPSARVLDEIVVTAQKIEQSLRDVPAAVSAVDRKSLQSAGVFGPEGIENFVPNVELDTDAQSPTIGVRGFSTDTYNVGLEPSVGIIVDEIPIGRTEFLPDGLFDIDQVQVLRGPQGTLFGKNTIAGVLIFESMDPEPVTGASLTLTGGEGDTRRAEGTFDLPLGELALSRLAGVHWKQEGEVYNSFLDREELASEQNAARLKFVVDPADTLQLKFSGQFSQTRTNYSPWQLYDTDPDALDYAQSKDPETEDDPFDSHTSFDLPGVIDIKTGIFSTIAQWQAGDGLTVTGIGGHADLDNDFDMDFDVSAADLVNVGVRFLVDQDSLELRFTGNNDLFGLGYEFVGGVFGFRSDLDINVDIELGDDIAEFGTTPAGQEALGSPGGTSGTPPLPLPGEAIDDGVLQHFTQRSKSTAVFGQATWSVTDALSLITGLRLGNERKDAVLMVQSHGPGISEAVIGSENFTRPLSRDENEVSPKLGLLYAFSNDWSSYLTWTRGYKSGGFNGISFQDESETKPLQFEPERGDNYELGVKARMFDGTMALNTTVYSTDVRNLQITSFNGIGFDVFNASKARLRGLEADMQWLTPWDWLAVNGALGVGRAEYASYENAPPTAEQQRACDDAGEETCQQDLSGRTLPKAPKITASLNPVVSIPIGYYGIRWGIDVAHRGDQYVELDLDEHSRRVAHTLYATNIGFGPQDGTWGIVLRGNNLTNVKSLTFVADHNLYANSYFAAQAPERSFSVSGFMNW